MPLLTLDPPLLCSTRTPPSSGLAVPPATLARLKDLRGPLSAAAPRSRACRGSEHSIETARSTVYAADSPGPQVERNWPSEDAHVLPRRAPSNLPQGEHRRGIHVLFHCVLQACVSAELDTSSVNVRLVGMRSSSV